jgi:predicted RNase H-like HicB family nuclease
METTRHYRVVIEPDEDGVFIATVPALPGVVDQGGTADEAYERVRESLTFALDCMIEDGEEIPPSDAEVGEIRGVELAVS